MEAVSVASVGEVVEKISIDEQLNGMVDKVGIGTDVLRLLPGLLHLNAFDLLELTEGEIGRESPVQACELGPLEASMEMGTQWASRV